MKLSLSYKKILNAGGSIILAVIIGINTTGCSRSPKDHLSQDEMARLMADLYLGEALIDYNYSDYPNDSTRKILRQSIYAKNGVTQEMVDSSMAWYGRNIEQFVTVQEKASDMLREQQATVSRDARFSLTEDGDSVTLWEGPQRLLVGERMPSRILSFSVASDSTWRDEDYFTLYLKPINSAPDIKARLLIDYADGTTSYSDLIPTYLNKYQVNMKSDSVLMPLRIYGYIMFPADSTGIYEVDSIYLTQQRKERIAHYYTVFQTFNPNADKQESSSEAEEIIEDSNDDDNAYMPVHNQRTARNTYRRHGTTANTQPTPSHDKTTAVKKSFGTIKSSSSKNAKPEETERFKPEKVSSNLQPAKTDKARH